MTRLIVLVALAVIGWKLLIGRWPWEPKADARGQALARARRLLGVGSDAGREEIVAAHRRLVAMVHPDRGGTAAQVHEANDARDLLLGQLPDQTSNPPKEPS